MTDANSRTQAIGWARAGELARAAVATVLVLAAPAVSLLPALTTGLHGTGTAGKFPPGYAVKFPPGYTVMIIVTILVTVAASALGAWIAGSAGFAPIRFVLAWWAVISVAVAVAGASFGYVRLTELGIAVLAAAMAGAAVGLPLAARR